MTWLALGGAAVLQLLAGVVRVRGWFHVIRHSWPGASSLRYRDVVLAHLGGVGWNAVLPARAGDAVKVVIVNRRMPERRLALLASTLVPPGLVEAVFTGLLVAGLVMTNRLSPTVLSSLVRPAHLGFAIAGAVAVAVVGAVLCRRHVRRFARSVRAGIEVLAHPRVMATRVVPWLAAGRGIRLLAFALVLPAAGVPLRLEPALALMALQGATPSAGAAATAARIALLAALLSGTGSADVAPEQVAGALAAAYGLTSAVNLAVSVVAIAWLLRTTSPRRIARYVRSALRRAPRERSVTPGRLRPVTEEPLMTPAPSSADISP